uniref:Serine/threonine-protein kinase 19 n=1 Tax=Salix viminalis TaxID=40686 RepID=A0A6N2LST9_SALVM
MDSVAESSKNRKRLREEEQQQEEIEAEETSSTDQTLSLVSRLAIQWWLFRIMRAQFPHIDKVSIQPFILHSQLYSSVKDRTQVDRELESLRREKVLRVFKLNTGQDDHAIMFLDDYLIQVDRAVKRMEEKKLRNLEVFEWFKTQVIDNKQDPSIDHQELCLLLSHGGKVKDEHISLLINAGLLTRQLIDPNMYWFAIPNIGSVLKGLSQEGALISFKPTEI